MSDIKTGSALREAEDAADLAGRRARRAYIRLMAKNYRRDLDLVNVHPALAAALVLSPTLDVRAMLRDRIKTLRSEIRRDGWAAGMAHRWLERASAAYLAESRARRALFAQAAAE